MKQPPRDCSRLLHKGALSREDMEQLRYSWVPTFARIENAGAQYYRNLHDLLCGSRKFLRLTTESASSAVFTSYADSVKSTVAAMYAHLLGNIASPQTHKCIHELLYLCRKVLDARALLVALETLPALSSPLLEALYMACNKAEDVPREALELAPKIVDCAACPDPEKSNAGTRLLLMFYQAGHREYRGVLEAMCSGRNALFYMHRVFPAFVRSEGLGYCEKFLAEYLRRPVLSLSPVSAIPPEHFAVLSPELRGRVISEVRGHSDTEPRIFEGLGVVENLLFDQWTLAELLSYFVSLQVRSQNVLYKVSSLLIRRAEKDARTCKCGGEDELERLSQILAELRGGTDGLKIQYCRIRHIIPSQGESGALLGLLGNKNMRVKWNALRALGRLTLSNEEVEQVGALLHATPTHKVKIWCLRALRGNIERMREKVSLGSIDASIYKEELLGLCGEINEGIEARRAGQK